MGGSRGEPIARPVATSGAAAEAAEDGDPRPWYADGLRFECTLCGNCCSGPEGVVWFTPEEGQAIAASLGLSEGDFLERYSRRVGQRRSLREVPSEGGHDCVFLARERADGRPRAVCSIYAVRPTQCRTWPFWPANLETHDAWDGAKRRTPCPGMDSGRLHTFVEITIARDRERAS